MDPLVTVYIITYKRRKLLQRALESVINQSYSNLEIIVVDDYSNDDTAAYMKTQIEKDSRITYVINDSNRGACFSRNKAIQMARGEFITGLDDDDEFTKDRVLHFVWRAVEKQAVYYSYYKVINKSFTHVKKGKKLVSSRDILSFNYVGNQVFAPTKVLRKYQGFDEQFPSQQDYDFWIRLIQGEGLAICVEEPTYIVHKEHEAQRISESRNVIKGRILLLKKHAHIMTRHQYKYHLYYVLKAKNKINVCSLINLVPASRMLYEFALYFWGILKQIKQGRISG